MTEENKYNFQKINENRSSGILMHISSLPGPYGIGTLGENARKFADFLKKAGQTYWQVLPVGPTSYGDSPYQSFSTFAGNPYFIDLDYLVNDHLLYSEEIQHLNDNVNPTSIDYGRIYNERFIVLRKAFERFNINSEDFKDFCNQESFWLDEYSLFMTLKNEHGGKSWTQWDEKYKSKDKDALKSFTESHIEDINFQKFMQYIFFRQWEALKKYCHERGIKIIGDIPIYVAEDSSDVWGNPELFKLQDDLTPAFVGGCPPDVFSDSGQLWGNPVYDWEANKKQNYKWWVERIKSSFKLFDSVRIDHFRGFESYWEIVAKSETAANGKWVQGPGYDLFKVIKEELGDLPIIAEDLGYMTKEVYEFRQQTAFPGMKIIQFAFNPEMNSEHMPHNYTNEFVVYAGTHDNETLNGWLKNIDEGTLTRAIEYGNLTKEEGYDWGIIRLAMTSVADTCIIQLQDILGLDNSARMNLPGTLGTNWLWRVDQLPSDEISEKLYKYTKNSDRLNKELKK
ncbi:4-alpha-glucanotransferase [Helcococcus kunzii]|uniref:4-alpha-glucanotransferase n=1 Tax=Helcococcus kunzii TaxID=40091 RepID=UPI0038A57175